MISDGHGTELLAVLPVSEDELLRLQPLTHAVVAARHRGTCLLVFNRCKRHWELAGGTIDGDESARACAVRELGEESGVLCAEAALRFVGGIKVLVAGGEVTDTRVEFGALFVVDVARPDPFAPNDEIADAKWWDGTAGIEALSPIDEVLIRAVGPA